MTKISDLEQRIVMLKLQCDECIVEISKKEHEIATLGAHIEDLQFRLLKSEMIGELARHLFHEIDKKIMWQLTWRGQKKKKIRHSRSEIKLTGHESYSQLLDVARIYDAQELFLYKSRLSKSSLRLHYRIAAKTYRVGRDSILRTGGLIHKIAGMVRHNA